MQLFHKQADYDAFERVIDETLAVRPMRVCAYCLMPNHWHLVLWPRGDGDLAAFMQRLTVTHARRWMEHRHRVGMGHVYQGRYKSFPVQDDVHYLTVCRYVERNPLRARLVRRAESWRWSSFWRRGRAALKGWPCEGPVPLPRDWASRVHQGQSQADLDRLHTCVARGRPFGEDTWMQRIARRLGLESSFRPVGRPRVRDVRSN